MFAEYRLKNAQGMEIAVSELGAAWISCRVPIAGEKAREVLLASNNIKKTLIDGDSYAGAIVGRYAGRIANAKYDQFELSVKQPPHTLHGGMFGFSSRRWDINAQEQRLICHLVSLAWEEGFPGNMHIEVIYTLEDNNQLTIDYYAKTDKDSACNLTNHAYFNLNGGDGNDGLEQKLQIFAPTFQPVTSEGIPEGEFLPVAGTSLDFQQEKLIARDFLADDWQKRVGGYDHSFILNATGECLPAAVLTARDEKIKMTIATTQPAIHLYTGQFLQGLENRAGGNYENCAGIALETQSPPDSPNRHPEWGILKAGEIYHHKTIYTFSG